MAAQAAAEMVAQASLAMVEVMEEVVAPADTAGVRSGAAQEVAAREAPLAKVEGMWVAEGLDSALLEAVATVAEARAVATLEVADVAVVA